VGNGISYKLHRVKSRRFLDGVLLSDMMLVHHLCTTHLRALKAMASQGDKAQE